MALVEAVYVVQLNEKAAVSLPCLVNFSLQVPHVSNIKHPQFLRAENVRQFIEIHGQEVAQTFTTELDSLVVNGQEVVKQPLQ